MRSNLPPSDSQWGDQGGTPCRAPERRESAQLSVGELVLKSLFTQGRRGEPIFHDLRRTGVRNLRRAGVDRKVAMAISGHRSESLFERYNIDTDQDLREAVSKVASYVDVLPVAPTVIPIRGQQS
jgi:hypothetical protein